MELIEPMLTSETKNINKDIVVFTDGSTLHNGKKNARGGYAVAFPDYPDYTKSYPLHSGTVTNNRAEFLAFITALESADRIDPERSRRLIVYTDSELLINTVTKWLHGWKRNQWKKADGKPVMNRDLLELMDSCMAKRQIVLHHVKAHSGRNDWMSKWNDVVDKMARKAAEYVGFTHVDTFFRS